MTGESAGQTDPWIKQTGAKFAYAYDKGSKLSRELGVSGIPHAFLVDPQGKIVWRGHPSSLTDAIVAEHLAGSLKKPLWEWPRSAAAVRKALAKRQYAKALTAAKALEQEDTSVGADILKVVEGLIAGKLETLQSAYKAGDYLTTSELGKELAKSLAGTREGEKAKQIVDELKANKEAKSVIKGQKKVRRLQKEFPRKRKDAEKVVQQLGRIIRKHEGTAAARDAEAYRQRILGAMSRMR